jgi:transcriptional regulator with XRE-family HTH domain
MSRRIPRRELPHGARARIADNLFLLRKRAGHSQEDLAELAMISSDRIGKIENGQAAGRFESYVRLAGALSVPVHDLIAGVTWTPAEIQMEVDAAYRVEWEPADSGPAMA